MTHSNLRKRVIVYSIIAFVWVACWMLRNIYVYPETILPRTFNEIWRAIYLTAVNFSFFEYAVPWIRRRRTTLMKILASLCILIILILLMSFGVYFWREVGLLTGIYTSLRTEESLLSGVEFQTPTALNSIIFFGVGVHIYDHFQLKRRARELQVEKQAAELAFLKSQTNPHFLFNTLNNIYALAKDNAAITADSILRLSGIMRFMLYYGNLPAITVKQELDLLNDYLQLEKLRYDSSFRLNFTYKVSDMQQLLPPLLLMPLLENAFKHGVSQTTEDPFMDMDLSVDKEQLVFTVLNSTPLIGGNPSVEENIGLQNLRRQLSLLYKDYDLIVAREQKYFKANLRITLSSHV